MKDRHRFPSLLLWLRVLLPASAPWSFCTSHSCPFLSYLNVRALKLLQQRVVADVEMWEAFFEKEATKEKRFALPAPPPSPLSVARFSFLVSIQRSVA